HQPHVLAVGATQGRERGEDLGQTVPGRRIGQVDPAQAELDVVRVEKAEAADLVLEGQYLGLELDDEVSRDVEPHVHLGGLLHVRMPELEVDFRVADGKSVLVREAEAEDEGVVVELEVPGIEEENLTDLYVALPELLGIESHPVLLRCPGDLVPEFEEALRRR